MHISPATKLLSKIAAGEPVSDKEKVDPSLSMYVVARNGRLWLTSAGANKLIRIIDAKLADELWNFFNQSSWVLMQGSCYHGTTKPHAFEVIKNLATIICDGWYVLHYDSSGAGIKFKSKPARKRTEYIDHVRKYTILEVAQESAII